MRWKTLPLIEQIANAEPEAVPAIRRGAMTEMARTNGFQLLLHYWQETEADAHQQLMDGTMSAETYRGFMLALELIKANLVNDLSVEDLVDLQNHDERDDPLSEYVSPFSEVTHAY